MFGQSDRAGTFLKLCPKLAASSSHKLHIVLCDKGPRPPQDPVRPSTPATLLSFITQHTASPPVRSGHHAAINRAYSHHRRPYLPRRRSPPSRHQGSTPDDCHYDGSLAHQKYICLVYTPYTTRPCTNPTNPPIPCTNTHGPRPGPLFPPQQSIPTRRGSPTLETSWPTGHTLARTCLRAARLFARPTGKSRAYETKPTWLCSTSSQKPLSSSARLESACRPPCQRLAKQRSIDGYVTSPHPSTPVSLLYTPLTTAVLYTVEERPSCLGWPCVILNLAVVSLPGTLVSKSYCHLCHVSP